MNRKKVDDKELKVEFARGGGGRGGYNSRGRGDYNRGDRGGYRGDRGDRDRGDRGGYQRDNFGGGNTRGCFNCNKEGHFARECPQPKKPRQFDNRGDRGGFRGRDNRDRNFDNRRRSNSDKSRSRSPDRKKNKSRRRSPSNSS